MWELKIEYPNGEVDTYVREDKAALTAILQALGEQDQNTWRAGTKFTVSIV